VQDHVAVVREIAACVDPQTDPVAVREADFAALQAQCATHPDRVRQRMAGVMARWAPGLFVGEAALDVRAATEPVARLPDDNLGLERFFKLPKHHARHIHGRAHAGIALVQQGPTLVPVLDAHRGRDRPFTVAELRPYRGATVPASQRAAEHRGAIMRRARSVTQRPLLLAELEARHLAAG
jgi:hypothetical protein